MHVEILRLDDTLARYIDYMESDDGDTLARYKIDEMEILPQRSGARNE